MAKDPCHLTPKQRLACDCDCAEIKAQQAFEKSVEKERAQTPTPTPTPTTTPQPEPTGLQKALINGGSTFTKVKGQIVPLD